MESTIKLSSIAKNINANNILLKSIRAKVIEVEEREKQNGEKYGKYLLKEGKTKVEVLAWGETYLLVKDILKPGDVTTFPPGTFSCKSRNKKFPSNSTCKHFLTFLSYSKFLTQARPIAGNCIVYNGVNNSCSIQEVSQLLTTSQPFTRKLKSIKFDCGDVHRYWGCNDCTYSIPQKHSDGKYYCKGSCNNKLKRRRKNGVPCERKICFRISDAKLTNVNDETIDFVVLFDSVCLRLFKKCGQDFGTDNEAVSAWKDLIANSRFDVTLTRRKKKKDSPYPAAVFVEKVDNVIEVVTKYVSVLTVVNEEEVPSSTFTKTEPEADSIYPDWGQNLNFGKKKKIPEPKFEKFDMKLQYRSEKYKKTSYQIQSKPHGLVLLINNNNFPDHEVKERAWCENDIDLLQRGFQVMGFEIYGNKCHRDIKTRTEFADLLEQFKNELRRRTLDSTFVIISSHGRNHQISLTGGPDEYVCVVEDLLIPFSDNNLPEYQGKPKVFMPLVCQNLGTKGLGRSLGFLENHLFDMLVCCPSFPGYAQTRFPGNGSLFVNLLMRNLMQYATSWHLKEILDKVQDDFKKQIRERRLTLTVPYYIASTFGRFVLVPKNDENINPFQDMEVDEL